MSKYHDNVFSRLIIFVSYSQANFKFHVSENTCTDRFVVHEDSKNENESCLEQHHEINAMSSSPASTCIKDEEQSGEETLSLDPEDNTRTQDKLFGTCKFNAH